ncbi:ig-like domain-containing protein [Trichonephila inaurata madagascariensis]|uniref:Ig-like domain-containing protein n=1 Tax=Trichonephila inaurata madagascariensis TaxID=2747483 RepID=A0A8X7BP14_9ARAC|nr:ig-like domain-containing protein [Trichonephila inaurata madagascariensis]
MLTIFFFHIGCRTLRFLNISVPGAIPVGEPVWLKCDFDLEGDDLYSVKWYKNHVEFYRYQPRDKPPGQTYRLAGTFVDSATYGFNQKLFKFGEYEFGIENTLLKFINILEDLIITENLHFQALYTYS